MSLKIVVCTTIELDLKANRKLVNDIGDSILIYVQEQAVMLRIDVLLKAKKRKPIHLWRFGSEVKIREYIVRGWFLRVAVEVEVENGISSVGDYLLRLNCRFFERPEALRRSFR